MNHHRLRAITLLCLAVLSFSSVPASARPSKVTRAGHAAAYVKRAQGTDGSVPGFSGVGTTADYVLDLVTVHRGRSSLRKALRYLRGQVESGGVTNTGSLGKVTMAVTASGRNPRSFGGHNLVGDIHAREQSDGEYGNSAISRVSDQTLAMLGLESAGVNPSARATSWLLAGQCPDGGWQFDLRYKPARDDRHCRGGSGDYSASDTNTTAQAIQALDAESQQVSPSMSPFEYLRSARDPHKNGWVYDATQKCPPASVTGCELTDANSTSLVIQAYVADGRNIPSGGMRALEALQYDHLCGKSGGSFAFSWERRSGKLRHTPSRADAASYGASNVGATVAAIPALLHRPLPLPSGDVTGSLPGLRAC
jgi:hypothetical protein